MSALEPCPCTPQPGPVGRLLITLFLIESQSLPAPLLYLSAFFEASRRDYYDGLRGISERGAWDDWLEYFLLGVPRMPEDPLSRAMRINGLLAEWQKIAPENQQLPVACSRTLGGKSVHHDKRRGGQIGDRVTTAQRAIERLELRVS